MNSIRRLLRAVLSVAILRRLALLLRRAVQRIHGPSPQIEGEVHPVLESHEHRLAGSEDRVGLSEARLDRSEARLDELERHVGDIEGHLPKLLNAIASFSGAARRLERDMRTTWRVGEDHARSINDLWERMEVIRRELMIEVRYGDRSGAAHEAVDPRIIDTDKVADAAEAGLRVNLGCGHLPLAEYVNVDMRELPGVDAIATATDLPFGEDSLEELFSAHLVEHFPQEQLEREVLPYWRSRIRPGGTLRMVLPDAGAMLEGFASGDIPWDELREVLYGGQEYEGDFHFNMYRTDTLAELLGGAGFEDVAVEAEGRRNGACLEMQVSARKPA